MSMKTSISVSRSISKCKYKYEYQKDGDESHIMKSVIIFSTDIQVYGIKHTFI